MDRSAIVRRYTDAFIECAREGVGEARALEELRVIRTVFSDVPDLKTILASPQIRMLEKSEIIDHVCAQGFSDETHHFLQLLLRKGRIEKFEEMAEYARVKYTHRGEEEAVFRTTYPLDADILTELKSRVETRLNKKFHMYVKLEPEMLGGVKVTFGNMVIDGSVRKRLSEIREKLLQAKVG